MLKVIIVVLAVTGAALSRSKKHHPDANKQHLSPATTDDPILLPQEIDPQVPVFFPERSDKRQKQKSFEGKSRVFKWGDIEAMMVEGFMIPIVKPQGPPPQIPIPESEGGLNSSEGNQEDILEAGIGPDVSESVDGQQLSRSEDGEGRDSSRLIKVQVSGSNPVMCGNYQMQAGGELTIESPYYPMSYGSNFKCRWILTALGGDGMLLTCPKFQLGKGDLFTTVIVGQSETLQKYKGKKGPVNVETNATSIKLSFTSNKRSNKGGFSCSVTVLGGTTTMNPTTWTTEYPETTTATTTEAPPPSPPTTTTTTTKTTTTKAPTTTTTTTTTTEGTTTTEVTTTTLPPLSHPDCGISNRPSSGRIVNGQAASPNEYPWQSFLEIKWGDGKSQLCGGSIITRQWILTAGHCVLRKHDNGNLWIPNVDVTLGMHTRTDPTGNGGYKLTAADVVIHPMNNFAFDLALIKLPREINYKHEVRPICLPNRDLHGRNLTGVLMALIGWGKIETGQLTTELRELSRYGIEAKLCQKVFGTFITDHHFCTSGINVKHICLGDSGGPVMTINRGRFTLTGVVSFVATSDCKGEYPDGHISVTHFLDWIQEVTGHVIY